MTGEIGQGIDAVPDAPPAAPSANPSTPLSEVATAPSAAVPASRPSWRTRNPAVVNGVLVVAIAVLAGGIAFAAGRATAPDIRSGGFRGVGPMREELRPGGGFGRFHGAPGGIGVPGAGGGMPGGARSVGPILGGASVRGVVRAVDEDSITLELADGNTIRIALDSNTDYHRRADASVSDASTGATVVVEVTPGRGLGRVNPVASDITIVP